MKILFINSDCGIGSTGKICTDLAMALQNEGHTVRIAYGRDINNQYQDIAVQIGGKTDLYYHGLKARFFDKSGLGSRRATDRFIKWVKEYDPDIIHLHNIHGYYINIEILFDYLKRSQKRILWTLHDCWAFTGHCAYFDMANCYKWKNGCKGKCPCVKDYPKSMVSQANYNWEMKNDLFNSLNDMTIVTPSVWLTNLVKQSFLKKYPIRVVHNGIDTTVYYPTESRFRENYGLEKNRLLLGVAAVWDKRKGLSDFIRLASMIDDDTRIVLVGLNKDQLKTLPSNIVGIERTSSSQELAGIYTTADVFLNLTYEDNYPTVNIEAQTCDTPVITYRTGGSIESVPANQVVEVGDLTSIINLINGTALQTLHDNSFDKKYMIKKYIELYKNNR